MDSLRNVQAVLEREKKVSEWVIRRSARNETQLYLIETGVEAIRHVDAEAVAVEVHNDHPARGGQAHRADASAIRRGVATVLLSGGEREDVAGRVQRAVFMASLADNQAFRLPGAPAGGYPAVEVFDKNVADDPRAVAESLAARLLDAVKAEAAAGISLSSAEFFLTTGAVEQVNSAGASGGYAETELYVEMVLSARGRGAAESERYVWLRRRRLADLDLEGWVREEAARARDSVAAWRPRTGTVDLVVETDDVAKLLEPVLFHASGQAAYLKLARLAPGREVWASSADGGPVGDGSAGGDRVDGDPLNLVSDGLLPFGTHTVSFDPQGVAAQRVPVVENNVVKNLLCSKQYADYLEVPPTGAAANIVLAAGKTPFAQLLATARGGRPVLRVVDFSSLEPDPMTGDFVAEIRLGYEENGAGGSGARPVKGGSVRGNVFEALAGARYAAETGFFGSYCGPIAVRLPNVVVAGE